jgi:putative proteasome-type protease
MATSSPSGDPGHAVAVTYCLAMRLDAGLLFLSDTRTNAGVDNVGTYRKLHTIRAGDDRVFVIQAAGSLATTHEVLARVDRDLDAPGDHESLATVGHLFEAALYLGRLNRMVTAEHAATVGSGAGATFILGGQIAGSRPDIMMVYSEGNYIRCSDTVPFLQIGEAKYGKFLLELAVRAHVDLQTAAKIALGSMLSTAHANLSVGPPYDAAVYRNGSLDVIEVRIEADNPYLTALNTVWIDQLLDSVQQLPPLPSGVLADFS